MCSVVQCIVTTTAKSEMKLDIIDQQKQIDVFDSIPLDKLFDLSKSIILFRQVLKIGR